MRAIGDAGPAIDGSDIVLVEGEIGEVLPPDYRAFLLRYNGGLPTPDIVDIPKLPGSPTDVQVLFGVRRSVESSNIAWNWHAYGERIPRGCLPIACDSGGNLFCMSIVASDKGAISYVDQSASPWRSYRVADSFTDFLDALRDFDS